MDLPYFDEKKINCFSKIIERIILMMLEAENY
jgi:hypothetical protein